MIQVGIKSSHQQHDDDDNKMSPAEAVADPDQAASIGINKCIRLSIRGLLCLFSRPFPSRSPERRRANATPGERADARRDASAVGMRLHRLVRRFCARHRLLCAP